MKRNSVSFIYLREVPINSIALLFFLSKHTVQRVHASLHQVYQKRYTKKLKGCQIFVLYLLLLWHSVIGFPVQEAIYTLVFSLFGLRLIERKVITRGNSDMTADKLHSEPSALWIYNRNQTSQHSSPYYAYSMITLSGVKTVNVTARTTVE